jgi:GTP-binding protein HflX
MDELLARIARDLDDPRRTVQVHLPYGREDLLAKVHREGHVLDVRHDGSGTLLSAEVDEALAAQLAPFMDHSSADASG